jgi:hypothetical protein
MSTHFWLRRCALSVLTLGLCFTWSSIALAYPWMIRHGYTGCNTCHADPSGGGLLTPYGRAQGELLLRTRYGSETKAEDPGAVANFLFGAVTLPDSLLLGADVRAAELDVMTPGSPATTQWIWMQADVEGQWTVADRVHFNGSLGYVPQGDLPASLTPWPADNIISRVHWVGADLDADKEWTLRAGRMNVPFGIRSIEHTYWVRTATGTDIDATQEDGLALAFNTPGLRGEAMLIAGNLQVSPADYRQRGYSAYLEWTPYERLALGASSLVTHADRDITLQTPAWRQAHGAFARWSPWGPLVVSTEWDATVVSQPPTATRAAQSTVGVAGMLNLDLEPLQGLHVGATGEILDSSVSGSARLPAAYGAWCTVWWFFAPRLDLRGDFVAQSLPAGPTRTSIEMLLAQIHAYL